MKGCFANRLFLALGALASLCMLEHRCHGGGV